jgi:hypothetical protein
MENNLAKEIEGIFSRVKEVFNFSIFKAELQYWKENFQMPGLEDPMEELQRQMQAFFIQKDREWEYKCIEVRRDKLNYS